MVAPLELEDINKKRRKFHNFFRFPGSFHPPLVKWLLNKHEKIECIGDPMSGSGAVALEGIVNNSKVVSMDIDPLSCMITKVKSNPISPEVYQELFEQWIELTGPLNINVQTNAIEASEYLNQVVKTTKYSFPPNPFHWFDPYVIISLSKLLLSLSDLKILNNNSREALEATFASIVRRVSKADPQPVSGLEVTKIMKKKLNEGLIFDVSKWLLIKKNILLEGFKHLYSLDSIGTSEVIQGNVIVDWYDYCEKKDIKFDVIITSPPYCNAIEYWRRHRLEYFWLNFLSRESILEKSREFIGSTTILQDVRDNLDDLKIKNISTKIREIENQGKIRKARILHKYFLDTEKWISLVLSTLDSNGTAYIVVGPSTSYGISINTPKYVTDIIKLEDYNVKHELKYRIINQRMQYPTRNRAKIKTETIISVTK